MAPYSLLHPLSTICLEDKIKFSTSQHLSVARSKWFALPETKSESDVWSIRPPDFSLKLYKSVAAPQRKGREENVAGRSETKRRTGLFLPRLLPESQRREEPKFISSYRPPDSLESELMFVQAGRFPTGPYKNPKPHNFRPEKCRTLLDHKMVIKTKVKRINMLPAGFLSLQLDEDLPDIVTTLDKDPGDLKLKLKHLDVFQTTGSESGFSSRGTKTRMDTCKPPEPTWDARLILPEPPWPPKSASYTRHRRRRGAYSAFLDRVEEKLSRSWENKTSL